MSKFVTITTRIRDRDCLREALGDVKAQVVDKQQVRGWRGTRRADLVAVTGQGEVGFRVGAEGCYEIVGDDMSIPPSFAENVTQHYARRKVLKEATKAGFGLVEDKVQTDGSMRLVVRKW